MNVADLANTPADRAALRTAPARGRQASRWLTWLAVLTAIAVVTMWAGQVGARGAVTRAAGTRAAGTRAAGTRAAGTRGAGTRGAGTRGAGNSAAAPQTGIVPPKNPSRSLPPSPNFMASSSPCALHANNSACNRQVLKAITHARKVLEKMGGMSSFSMTAYLKLTRPEQLFVTANLERTERGLPAATVLSKTLDRVAQIGARNDDDPPLNKVPADLPGGGAVVGLGSNWAGGWPNALAADYGWMYDDGLNSPNEDCTKSNTAGCWGHRDNILGTFSSKAACGGGASALAMGAGYTAKKASQTQLFAGVCGPAPTDVLLTWTKAKKLLGIK
jgi:hypothetical protein